MPLENFRKHLANATTSQEELMINVDADGVQGQNGRQSMVNVDKKVVKDEANKKEDFISIRPRGLPEDVFFDAGAYIIERKQTLTCPRGAEDEEARLLPFAPFRTASDNDNLHNLPNATKREADRHFINLDNPTKEQKMQNAMLTEAYTAIALQLKGEDLAAKPITYENEKKPLKKPEKKLDPKIEKKNEIKPKKKEEPQKTAEPLKKIEEKPKPSEIIKPKPIDQKKTSNPKLIPLKKVDKPLEKPKSLTKPPPKKLMGPKGDKSSSEDSSSDESSSDSDESSSTSSSSSGSSSDDDFSFMFPGMGMPFPMYGMQGPMPMPQFGGYGGYPQPPPQGGYGGYPQPPPQGGYGGYPQGGYPAYQHQYPQHTHSESTAVPSKQKTKKRPCKLKNTAKKDEGLNFEFLPHDDCCTEVTLTIEPDEPDPLECAIENGIMPIVCCYMPPSLTLDPKSPLGVKTAQLSSGELQSQQVQRYSNGSNKKSPKKSTSQSQSVKSQNPQGVTVPDSGNNSRSSGYPYGSGP